MIDDVLFDVCRFVSIGLSEHTPSLTLLVPLFYFFTISL